MDNVTTDPLIFAALFVNDVADAAAARAGAHAFHVEQDPGFADQPEHCQPHLASPTGQLPATKNFCCRPIIADEFARAQSFRDRNRVPLEMFLSAETIHSRPLRDLETELLAALGLKRIN